ncbi:hypothetical protein EMIT048CA2_50254 [Pseudomonas chlororaphis]
MRAHFPPRPPLTIKYEPPNLCFEPKKLTNQSGSPHPTAMRHFFACGFSTPAKIPLCREWANTRPERGICPARLWWVS